MAISGQPGVNDNLKYLGDSELFYGDINGILEPPMLAGDDSLAVRRNYNALYGEGNAMIEFTQGGKDYLRATGDSNALFGDASQMFDNSLGGDDTLLARGRQNFLRGDANEMLDNAQGGNDII
jgi:hypothetical protein